MTLKISAENSVWWNDKKARVYGNERIILNP